MPENKHIDAKNKRLASQFRLYHALAEVIRSQSRWLGKVFIRLQHQRLSTPRDHCGLDGVVQNPINL